MSAPWFPPAYIGFAERGREWDRVAHWSKATLETLRATQAVCALGTWRRAWVDAERERGALERAEDQGKVVLLWSRRRRA